MFPRSDSGKAVDERWHAFRQKAKRIAFSPDEFSEVEKVRYDLDTAGITGRDNPRTFRMMRAMDALNQNGIDIRDLRNR